MHDFPEAVSTFLQTYVDQPRHIQRLEGLSGAGIWRVTSDKHSLIVKHARQQREALFYRQLAPYLSSRQIATPALVWSLSLAAGHWLILEDIPAALPRWRWLGDPEVLALLRRLHQTPLSSSIDTALLFQPKWSAEMNQAALAWFPAQQRSRLSSRLENLRQRSSHLFTARCYLSGDPNVMNWGVRRDGSLVLFDWERFGIGSAALDVAISVPGLGDREAFSHVASVYAADSDPQEQRRFARDLALAKAWSVTEFLSMFRPGTDDQPAAIEYLCAKYPGWIEAIVEHCGP